MSRSGRWARTAAAALAVAALAVGSPARAEPGERASVERARRVALRAASLRGLAFDRPPCVRVSSPAAILDLVRARVRSQYGPEDLAREGALLAHLGLGGDPAGYERAVYARLDGEVSGFYDPAGRCIHVVAGARPEQLDETVAHEAVHALQDLHFDLGRLLARAPGDSDRLQAASAVVEGDATLVALLFAEPGATERERARWPSELRRAIVPPRRGRGTPLDRHLGRTLGFAYADGLAFVRAAHRRGGWPAVDRLLRSPPASSTQVLRPAVASGPLRLGIEPPPALGAEMRVALRDRVGEVVLRSVLEEAHGRRRAAETTDGLLGDEALLLEERAGGATALALATAWGPAGSGGEAAAARFARALDEALVRRLGPRPPGHSAFERGSGRCTLTSSRGRSVVLLDRVRCEAVDPAAREAHGMVDRALERSAR